jgi:sulfopyruvate decarboxylase TPP-binding subunit
MTILGLCKALNGNLKIRVTIEEEGFLLIADAFLNGK